MATINDYYSPYAVVPKLPRVQSPYASQQNTDPSAYYTKALGFLPIDTRYMVNPTNSLTYNSMADVLFNKEAQDRRWANTPWMQGMLNPLRLIADTFLLAKDTVADPMIQGAIDDGFSGFLRGSSTALMNSLVNLGNTLDIVANPVKGLFLEGGEGFIKGLVGDENGRKQYDYINYIDTGNGVTNFINSMILEIVSDPLNWISFGGKAAISSGAKAVSNTAVDSITTTLKNAVKTGATNVDELAAELSKTSKFLTKDSAKATIEAIAGSSGKLTDEAIDTFGEGLKSTLQNTIKRVETANKKSSVTYKSMAENLAQGKGSRAKASFLNRGPEITPAMQATASNYFKAIAEGADGIALPSINNAIRYGGAAYRGADTMFSVLRKTAGITGINEIVWLNKGGAKAAGIIRNKSTLKDPNIIKTIDDLTGALDIKTVEKAIEAMGDTVNPAATKELVGKLYIIKDSFTKTLFEASHSGRGYVSKIKSIQKNFITEADALIKELDIKGVTNYTEYIKYLENSNVVLKNTELTKLIDELQTINKVLSEDFSDPAVRAHYKKTTEALSYKYNQEARGQAQQMRAAQKDFERWYAKYGDTVTKELEHSADTTTSAIEALTKINKTTGLDLLGDLDRNIIPGTLDALRANNVHEDIIKAFEDSVEEFRSSLKNFETNDTDFIFRENLVKNYNSLVEELQRFRKFDIPEEGINATNAPFIRNQLGETALKNSSTTVADVKMLQPEAAEAAKDAIKNNDILKRANKLEAALATDTEYRALRNYYTQAIKEDPYFIEPERRFSADAALIKDSEISKAVDKLVEPYIDATYNTAAYVKYGLMPTEILDKAKKIRPLAAVEPISDVKIKTISQAIEELQTFAIKPMTSVIDPADVSKYKLVIYSIMNRTASVVNRLMGIAADGSAITNRIVESIKVTPTVLDSTFKNKTVGAFFKDLQDKNLLPKAYEIISGSSNNALNFAIGIKYRARELIGANYLHTTAGDYIKNYSWMDLDLFAKDNPAFQKAWKYYNEALEEYDLARINQLDDVQLIAELNEAAVKLKAVLDEQTKLLPPVKYIRSAHTDVLKAQAQNILKMSDEDIIALAKFDSKEIYNYPEAHLAKLIDEYSDTTGDLYRFLNNPDNINNPSLGSTITASKNLIERLRSYKSLVTEVSDSAKANGLDGFYIEGLLDSLMTQLSKRFDIDNYPVARVVDDLLSGTNLYVRNLYDAPSTAMDSVLGQVVKNLSENTALPQEARVLVDRIRGRLEAGKAHSAVTDVDNLVDLIQLSKYTNDVRVKDLLTKLASDGKGKRRVVFDIESTGANEAAAHIFQISGKVLDENNLVVKGSEFNYIIKPPTGYKPTLNVLKTLTQDADPEKWWVDNIVNAKPTEGTLVFESIEDALSQFVKHCDSQGPIILVGHNIKGYDLAALAARSRTAKTFFNKVDKFDTLEHMNSNTMFQLTGAQEQAFKNELDAIFTKAVAENNPALLNKPFQYADIRTLSELKQVLKDVSTSYELKQIDYTAGFSQNFSKSDIDALAAREYGGVVIDDATGKTKGTLAGIQLEAGGSVGELEKIINGVVDEWRSPAKLKTNDFFLVSKLNPDSLEKQIQGYLDELGRSGLYKDYIGVAPGKNIMQYFGANVSKSSILINPVRVISYEVEDIFDLKKALDVFKVVDKEGVLRVTDLSKLTKQATHIQRIRNWIPKDYVDLTVADARAFLKAVEPYQNFIKVLYDDADNITVVAAAVYAYKLLKEQPPMSAIRNANLEDVAAAHKVFNATMDEYKHFGNVSETISNLRGKTNSTGTTPLLHQIDADTGLPRALFEDDWYTYDQLIDVVKKDMILDNVRKYRIENNLYGLHDVAKHAMLEPIYNLSKEIESYLKGLGEGREAVEQAVKQYNTALDYAGINNILKRPNRVNALKEEAFVRGGYVCFETNSKIDLTDFKADKGFVVVDNMYGNNGRYVHIIAATRETFNAAQDINLAAVTIKGVDGIDDTMFGFLKRIRDYASDKLVKNLGYSRGDVITSETIDYIQDALRRAGVSEDVIKTLPDVDALNAVKYKDKKIVRPAFFNTSRANISIIGDRSLWSFITNRADISQIQDPFKQFVRTVFNANADRTTLFQYCSLLLNKHSGINTAEIFKALKPEDLYKLLKKNDDFVMVYITKTGYWNNTKSGLIVKEFDLVNVNSIKRAKEVGGVHIIPRTEAAQLMKAVNEFDLPPIAKIAKGISDVYKVAYLGSLGFLIRNIIDSNYKTYASLNGQVSLGKSVGHFVESLGIVRKHTKVGQEYTKAVGRYFKTDLEYDVFYKYCNSFGDEAAVQRIIIDAPDKLQKTVAKYIKEFSENKNLTAELINEIKPNLIKTEMFSIVDAFINYGPSAGLSKTILSNIPTTSKAFDDAGALTKFNKWITQDTPARFVYGANDYIEQAARLSMFLQRLELGDTIDDANKAIIKTHFDYSDKSIGMLYTEIVFPFMSFSYKNLNFWVDMMYKNPALVGQMQHIFRTILDYQGLFEPDQEAYEDYDYTFDWSKDVMNFKANAPWTQINAARLYHILNGNILIKHGNNVMHDAGYGAKENELYTVFKLSPSVLDATKMLFTPLNTYSERLLPPYETLVNIFKGMNEGKNITEQVSVSSLVNMLPYFDTMMQRVGRGDNFKLRHNNLYQRIEDAGPHQAFASVFGTAYVPVKDNQIWYDSDYNILGGLKTNYYAKKNYSNPYNSKYPTYTLTRMAQNKKPKDIYAKSKTNKIYNQQYNNFIRGLSYRSLEYRLKDYYHYY